MRQSNYLIIGLLVGLVGVLVPRLATAQTSELEFSELIVELWPEYDRPEALVIYRASMSSDTQLPVTVTLRFPDRIGDFHAIAIEQNGGLLNVAEENIQRTQKNGELLLTLTTESPNIHLEYYDPELLIKDGTARELNYSLTSDYPTTKGLFQVQVPYEAEGFSITPTAGNIFTDRNGFSYHSIETAELATGDQVEINATYLRNTDVPSVQFLPGNAPEHAADIQVITQEAARSTDFSLGYILIGVGVLLLLITGGYWWWSMRQAKTATVAVPPQSGPRAGRRGKRSSERKNRQKFAATKDSGSGYCFQCGTALRADAKFCHVCGAQRREG